MSTSCARSLAAVALTALLPALGAVACTNAAANAPKAPAAAPPREVDVLTITPSEVRDTGEYLGALLSRDSVQVLTQVNGYARRIHVRPGQRVKAGAPLVDIDAREEAAALETAVAQRGAAEARLELARGTLTRMQTLYDQQTISVHDLERARAEFQSAEAATKAAAATVSQRQVQVQLHTLRAAMPGVIGEVSVRVGDYVNAGTRITSIAQVDVLEVSVAIPAARARTLPPDAPVEILDRDGNVLVRSALFYVAPEADPRTQLIDVKAVFPNTVGLRPSELVRARVVYGARQALQVPALAVVRQSGQPFVLAVAAKDGATVVQRRPVTLGPLGERAYVVDAGLQAGDRIAVSSIQMLRDGSAIAPKEVATRAAAAEGLPPVVVPDKGP